MKIISVDTMRELDRRTIEAGTPGAVLMARAGEGAFREILQFVDGLDARHKRAASVIAGKGNNGGDAYVVAALLSRHTALAVTVYSVCPVTDLSGDARRYAEKLPGTVEVRECADGIPDEAFRPGSIIIDGLLGTGIRGPLRTPYDTFVRQINDSGLPVFAIDIPSGLDGDTGEIATAAVEADLTVTMACPKRGMLTPSGLRQCGQLRCIDIGIPSALIEDAEASGEAIFAQSVAHLLRRRPADGHKGTFGRVLVIGGSRLFSGAPVMTGTAALRSGTGLATVAVPATIRGWCAGAPRALIFEPVPEGAPGHFGIPSIDALRELKGKADAVVIGPGIDLEPCVHEAVREVLGWDKPTVVDADALKIAAGMKDSLCAARELILTPHPGEMRVLLAGLELEERLGDKDRVEQASGLASELSCCIVLKGQGTIVADKTGRAAVNTSGNSGLGSAGSGDILAGLLAGFLAQGYPAWDAVRLGTFVHGRTAELSAHGRRALIADDLLDLIGTVFRELTPFA